MKPISTLTFDYEFEFDNDTVYFCYCIPYSYSDLLENIKIFKRIGSERV